MSEASLRKVTGAEAIYDSEPTPDARATRRATTWWRSRWRRVSLYAAGVLLTPAVGAIFMSVSTVIVAINARVLRLPEPAQATR